LVALLSSEVVLHSDSGGKSAAVPNLVHGASNVARAILGALKKLVPPNLFAHGSDKRATGVVSISMVDRIPSLPLTPSTDLSRVFSS